jgi:hypothetical protein
MDATEPTGVSLPGRRSALVALGLALVLTAGNHLLVGDLYLNLRDEGYLWYGVVRVLAGEVPLRDFQAYDPGRYYWCAALSPLVGDGILGVRASVAAFQAIGVFLGLLVVRRLLRPGLAGDLWLLPAGLLFLLWMFPRFKLFEATVTLAGVWVLVRLLERPDARRHLSLGLVVGLAAFFGRNHGVYLAAASLATLALLAWRGAPAPGVGRLRGLGAWAGGVVLGYAPLLAMLALVPGFASAFREAVFSVLERGANLPKPYPWPWRADLGELAGFELAGELAVLLGFLLPVLCLPLGLVTLARTRGDQLARRAPLVAACLVGTIYVHHYSLCSDLPHLAQAIPPVLLTGLALAALPRSRALLVRGALVLLLAHAALLALARHPVLQHFGPGEPVKLAAHEVAGEELRLKARLARHLRRVEGMVETLVGDEELLIVPTRPTMYPLLGKTSPLWWIYFLWPATEAEQEETLRRLDERGVNWALVVEKSFDRQEEYDFRHTNPRVWEHFQREWLLVRDPSVPKDYFLFRRRP